MKHITKLLLVSFALVLTSCGNSGTSNKRNADFELEIKENYAPGEETAQQVLLAYRTKNVDLLKKHASSIMSMTLDENAMERPNFEKELNSWDGSIKEMRYDSDEITFQKYYYAHAHFYTNKKNPDIVYVVGIQSTDKVNWVITVNPLRKLTRAKFEERSKQLPQ